MGNTMDNVETTHLSQIQTQLLLAIYLSGTPEEGREIARRSANTAAAAKTLISMEMLVIGAGGAALTKAAVEQLKSQGYIDEEGQTTEYGQQFYQQAASALSEQYHIIRDLISSN